MTQSHTQRTWPGRLAGLLVGAGVVFWGSCSVWAGGGGWLDDVLRQIVRDAQVEGRALLRTGERSAIREWQTAGKLAGSKADHGLETLVERARQWGRQGHTAQLPIPAVVDSRFQQLVRDDAARQVFHSLAIEQKQVVVTMGETALALAKRHPQEAEKLIDELGTEGLLAVRVFGEDVAPVLASEGPQALRVLRRTGKAGWGFLTTQVLPHKKKLAAAGVLTLFWADPERFVDSAGQATSYAINQFARAGLTLAAAAGAATVTGLDQAMDSWLAGHGLNHPLVRAAACAACTLAALIALLAFLGLPSKLLIRPIAWITRPLRILRRGT